MGIFKKNSTLIMEDASELKDTEAAESSRLTHTKEWHLPNSEPSISLRDKATLRESSRILSTIPDVEPLSLRFNSATFTSTSSELNTSSPSRACTLACSSMPVKSRPPSWKHPPRQLHARRHYYCQH